MEPLRQDSVTQPAQAALPRTAHERVLVMFPNARIDEGALFLRPGPSAHKWIDKTDWEEVARLLGV